MSRYILKITDNNAATEAIVYTQAFDAVVVERYKVTVVGGATDAIGGKESFTRSGCYIEVIPLHGNGKSDIYPPRSKESDITEEEWKKTVRDAIFS